MQKVEHDGLREDNLRSHSTSPLLKYQNVNKVLEKREAHLKIRSNRCQAGVMLWDVSNLLLEEPGQNSFFQHVNDVVSKTLRCFLGQSWNAEPVRAKHLDIKMSLLVMTPAEFVP